MTNADDRLLEAVDVHRVFTIDHTEVRAVRGVSLQIRAGETVSVTGASGAGKSTLLHVLGGLDRPSEGTVRLGGQDLYATSQNARADIRATEFGFVFQGYHLLPELDVLENVMVPAMSTAGARLFGARARRARALELLDRVGLSERAKHRPTELSGGEQQRVAIARALMNEPGILLADEPTGNLDSKTGDQVLEHLFTIAHEQGQTLIIVTHNNDVAERCGRQVCLHDGRLVP